MHSLSHAYDDACTTAPHQQAAETGLLRMRGQHRGAAAARGPLARREQEQPQAQEEQRMRALQQTAQTPESVQTGLPHR